MTDRQERLLELLREMDARSWRELEAAGKAIEAELAEWDEATATAEDRQRFAAKSFLCAKLLDQALDKIKTWEPKEALRVLTKVAKDLEA